MTEPDAIGSPDEGCDMMTAQQAAEHLRVIRELMERPVRDTTRSGLAGILAGLLALAGCFATWTLWTDLPGGRPPLGGVVARDRRGPRPGQFPGAQEF